MFREWFWLYWACYKSHLSTKIKLFCENWTYLLLFIFFLSYWCYCRPSTYPKRKKDLTFLKRKLTVYFSHFTIWLRVWIHKYHVNKVLIVKFNFIINIKYSSVIFCLFVCIILLIATFNLFVCHFNKHEKSAAKKQTTNHMKIKFVFSMHTMGVIEIDKTYVIQ